jgi:hypothetical protein
LYVFNHFKPFSNMSLLDTASLIVTPNGYKEGKLYSVIPSDGSGDLSVVRATTATRVNSAGLVELVPYNLFTYSEQFDNADWSKSSGTITANSTTAPNGTTTADTFTGNGALSNHDFFEGFTGGANTTASIYVKKNTAQFVYISLNYQSSGVNWATGVYDLDNLTTATFQSGGVTNQVATITDEGNGWRRITLSVDTANTTLFCMYGLSNSMSPTLGSRGRVENSSSQSFYAWGAQVVEGSTAKDYQKTETRLNIPRLDYSNGTCPSLLVEPQRTNGFTYSSSFDNADWVKDNSTILANNTISPSGIQDADKLQENNTNNSHLVRNLFTGGGSNTLSVYAKKAERDFICLFSGGGTIGAYFDINNGSVVNTFGSVTANIQDVGNGWYRCSVTFTLSGLAFAFIAVSNNGSTISYTGTTGSGIYIWGAQAEVGSYSTSYIPTTSASVTRNADVISKTGISSLIGQTEGTMFIDTYIEDLAAQTNDPVLIYVKGTSADAYIEVFDNGQINAIFYDGSTSTGVISVNVGLQNGRHKFAFGYKDNNFTLFLDGTQIGTDTSGAVSGSLTEFGLNYYDNFYRGKQYVNAAALWQTRLTNTQLAQLTTI